MRKMEFKDAGRTDCGSGGHASDATGHFYSLLFQRRPWSIKSVFLDQSADLLLGDMSILQTGLYRVAHRVLARIAEGNRPNTGGRVPYHTGAVEADIVPRGLGGCLGYLFPFRLIIF